MNQLRIRLRNRLRAQLDGSRRTWRGGHLANRLGSDAGMNTAEYAVGTLAAVAFAGILLTVLTSDTVQSALQAVVERALG